MTAEPAYRPPCRASYQGAPGAFSEEAARALLGADAQLLPCRTLADVFSALDEGRADAAVVPLVNTLAGPIPHATALIGRHRVRILRDRHQPIVQSVIGVPGATIDTLTRVYSHPMALAQCERWFTKHPHVKPVDAFDTAGAIQDVLRAGDPTAAAVGPKRAAALYGGIVLEEAAQDSADNMTHFVLVSLRRPQRSSKTV